MARRKLKTYNLTVRIYPEQLTELRRVSAETDRPMSRLIREGIDLIIKRRTVR